jgi:RNA polymerase-binding transcription factor DksA
MTDLKAREEQLRTRLGELMGRLHRIDDHLHKPPERDWDDGGIEAEMDETLEGLGHAGTQEVQAIHAALKRIQSGTYGECMRCAGDISEERLDVLPHTPLCRSCAQKLAEN